MSQSNFNRQVIDTGFYQVPDLHPVTERAYRKPVQSHRKKHTNQHQVMIALAINAALIFGLAQCVRALVFDAWSVSNLVQSQAAVNQSYAETRQEHRALSDKIRIYSSASGIEELARNYLNMVGENELPVRFQ